MAEWYPWRGGFVSYVVWVPREYANTTEGLFGDFDGNYCNEHIDRGGERLPDICDFYHNEGLIYNHTLACKSKVIINWK